MDLQTHGDNDEEFQVICTLRSDYAKMLNHLDRKIEAEDYYNTAIVLQERHFGRTACAISSTRRKLQRIQAEGVRLKTV